MAENKGAQTVSIGCKLPGGLVMRVFDMIEAQEAAMGGGFRTVKVAREREERHTLNGWSHAMNRAPAHAIIGGYGITHGIPKDFWELWREQNSKSDLVVNKLIFAHVQAASADSIALELASTRSGLERLDPAKLPKGLTRADANAKL